MVEIVNLRRFRKARAQALAEIEAQNNRLKFSRTKAEKQQDERAEQMSLNHWAKHRLSSADIG